MSHYADDPRNADLIPLHAGETVPKQGWQPIESVPKDGSTVLLSDVSGGDVHSAFWDEVDYNEFRGMAVMGWNFGAAVIDDSNYTPVFWMEMPEPPK